jgi:hypothetical protein
MTEAKQASRWRVELAPNCLAIELNVEIAPENFKMSASSVEPKPSSFDQDIHPTR